MQVGARGRSPRKIFGKNRRFGYPESNSSNENVDKTDAKMQAWKKLKGGWYSSGFIFAQKCLQGQIIWRAKRTTPAAGENFWARCASAPQSRGPGTSEASALSPPQAKIFGLGGQNAPRSRGPGTIEASALSPPQAKNLELGA